MWQVRVHTSCFTIDARLHDIIINIITIGDYLSFSLPGAAAAASQASSKQSRVESDEDAGNRDDKDGRADTRCPPHLPSVLMQAAPPLPHNMEPFVIKQGHLA